MSGKSTPPAWARPELQRGGGIALVWYVVYGALHRRFKVSPRHRVEGGHGDITIAERPRGARWIDPEGSLALKASLAKLPEATRQAVLGATKQYVVMGQIPDPPDLLYLRDTVGMVAALLDAGAVAVVDPQIAQFFDAEDFRANVFGPDEPRLEDHLSVIVSDDGQSWWVHTRGMRKFARPDFSLRRLERDQLGPTISQVQEWARAAIRGRVFADGARLGDRTCQLISGDEDPDFNNQHLELT